MKGVFNKAALMLVLTVLCSGLAASGHAQVYFSVRGLLTEQFHQSEVVDFQRIRLSAERRAELGHKLGQKLERAEYIFYIAHSGEQVDGYALFDREIGQHEYIDFATFFDANVFANSSSARKLRADSNRVMTSTSSPALRSPLAQWPRR